MNNETKIAYKYYVHTWHMYILSYLSKGFTFQFRHKIKYNEQNDMCIYTN